MKKVIVKLLIGCSLLLPLSHVQANQFCFASAKTLYEQIYCELQAKGKTKGMPSFEQFSRNNEVVQVSLLKVPAERNGITLPAPKKIQAVTPASNQEKANDKIAIASPPVKEVSFVPLAKSKVAYPEKNCQMVGVDIHCNSVHYSLIGNKNNKHLAEGVLTDANKIGFSPQSKGVPAAQYLVSIYRQYIEKMCAIGLCGVTMTYGKFSYLFDDLQEKKVDFNKRFEIMYSFLKKDKETMWVSEKVVSNTNLAIEDCDYLSEQYFVCSRQGQNYVYERQ
jgi:hypothetical protein